MKFKILLVSILLLVTPLFTSAVVIQPFGGRIILSYPCPCSGGLYMLIADPRTKLPLPIVFQLGFSRLNAQFNIFTPGVNVLGTFIPGGVCGVYSATGCSFVPAIGTVTSLPMSGVGTALTPLGT